MNLKELLGDAYREDMTLEEVEQALKDLNLVDPSTLPKSVSKEVFDKTASELARYKRELKELQEKNMTAEEKLKLELEKAAEAQAKYAKELSKLRATEIFVTAGLSEEDYTPLIDIVVSEDEELTKIRAKSMVDVIASQKKAVEKAVKAELLKGTPKPETGEPSKNMTLDDFRKMSLMDKQKFARENPELYQSIYKEE
jgi:hypothetical protein